MSEVGTIEDSIINFEQARENIERVVRDRPDSPEYRFLLARTRCFLANRYDKASRPGMPRTSFDQALADFERLVARAIPPTARIAPTRRRRSSSAPTSSGTMAICDGSRRDYIASIAIGAALVDQFPDDLEILDKHALITQ